MKTTEQYKHMSRTEAYRYIKFHENCLTALKAMMIVQDDLNPLIELHKQNLKKLKKYLKYPLEFNFNDLNKIRIKTYKIRNMEKHKGLR